MEFSDLWDIKSNTTAKQTSLKKEAGISVLEGPSGYGSGQSAIMYCNTTDWAFGPVFTDDNLHYQSSGAADTATRFIDWHRSTFREDPRNVSDKDLGERISQFHKKFHAFTPWEGRAGICGNCSQHYDQHAEATFAKPCGNCDGSGQSTSSSGRSSICYGCDGAGRVTDQSAAFGHSGQNEDGSYIENKVDEER